MINFSKYSNRDNLNKYIRNIETSINKYKIKENEQSENIDELSYKLVKQEKVNDKLREQIENLNNF